MDLPDVKDLSAAPTWLAVTFLVVAVLYPVLTTLLSRWKERRKRRRHHHHDHPDDDEYTAPAIERAVTGATEMLDEAIDDLRAQRDRLDGERARLQRALDKARDESAAKSVTIARLQAENDLYRNQLDNRGNRGGPS